MRDRHRRRHSLSDKAMRPRTSPPMGQSREGRERGQGLLLGRRSNRCSTFESPWRCKSACVNLHLTLTNANVFAMGGARTIAEWVEAQQASGRYVFTREDAEAGLGGSKVAVQTALRRLKQKGRIASPRRGFYVVVPPEYRVAGCPPASWFIDDLMMHLGLHYYVGVLSAAALHGAGHQQPMMFQVIADRATRPMQAGRVRIEVHTSRTVKAMPVTRVETETGTMVVATPETTAFDLVRFFSAAGYWNNVAMVLSELAENIDRDRLVDIAPHVHLPDVQRLGYLLSVIGEGELAEPLASWLAGRRTTIVRLRTDLPKGDADLDPRWRLFPNEQVDIDL